MKTKNITQDKQDFQVITLSPKQLGTIAALDSSAFSKLNVNEAIPATWEERAKKAWEYYTEEPIIANIIDTWKAFAIGDEIKITCDNEDVKGEAIELAGKLNLHKLLSDLLTQTMVKGAGYPYKRYNKAGDDIEQVLCLNPLLGFRYLESVLGQPQK